jgi:hypothetical protein
VALSASERAAGMRGSMPVLARMTWPQNSTPAQGPKPARRPITASKWGLRELRRCTVSPDDLMAEVADDTGLLTGDDGCAFALDGSFHKGACRKSRGLAVVRDALDWFRRGCVR